MEAEFFYVQMGKVMKEFEKFMIDKMPYNFIQKLEKLQMKKELLSL